MHFFRLTMTDYDKEGNQLVSRLDNYGEAALSVYRIGDSNTYSVRFKVIQSNSGEIEIARIEALPEWGDKGFFTHLYLHPCIQHQHTTIATPIPQMRFGWLLAMVDD